MNPNLVPQGTISQFLDPYGFPIPSDHLLHTAAGQMFDQTQLQLVSGQWCYRGTPVVWNDGSMVISDYASLARRDAYREPPEVYSDDSPPDSAKHDNDHDSEESKFPQPSTITLPARKLESEPLVARRRAPKLQDLSLSKTETTQRIGVHSETMPEEPSDVTRWAFEEAIEKEDLMTSRQSGRREMKHNAYEAQDLMSMGAIQCFPCRPSDLVYSPTMTAFREENFVDFPSDVFNILKPALALCEKIIKKGHPQFWIDIACGRRMVDVNTSIAAKERIEILFPVLNTGKAHYEKTWDCLQRMGRRVLIFFRDSGGDGDAYARCISRSVMPHIHGQDYSVPHEIWPKDAAYVLHPWEGPNPWDTNNIIQISNIFYVAAKTFASQKYPEPAALLRFQFFFAVNLCHELAHAFEAKCGHGAYYDAIQKDYPIHEAKGHIPRGYLPRFNEAKYKKFDPPEIGAAFEDETFGGRVDAINGDVFAKYGLGLLYADGERSLSGKGWLEFVNNRPVGRAIPMGYIEELFQESYWTRPRSEHGLKIPQFCAGTNYSQRTTTSDWRQYFRDYVNQDLISPLLFNALPSDIPERGHDTKRTRLDPATTTVTPVPRRRSRQTTIRKYTKQSDIDVRQMKAEARALAEAEEAGEAARVKQEKADAEVARQYRPPSPNQPAIDDTFKYISSKRSSGSESSSLDSKHDPNSESYDPLTKEAGTHNLEDKWILFEEYCHLSYGWDAATFNVKRAKYDLYPAPNHLHPMNDPNNWGEAALQALRNLRKKHPDRSLPARQKLKREINAANQKLWTTVREMEELVTYKGFSRIGFQRAYTNGDPLPSGMTVENFNEKFRSQLLAYRAVNHAQSSSTYQRSVSAGEAIPVYGTRLTANLSSMASPRTPTSAALEFPDQSSKITDFFRTTGRQTSSAGPGKPTAQHSVPATLGDDDAHVPAAEQERFNSFFETPGETTAKARRRKRPIVEEDEEDK